MVFRINGTRKHKATPSDIVALLMLVSLVMQLITLLPPILILW